MSISVSEGDVGSAFVDLCRHWRMTRKLSQLDVSLRANVSQRHVSYLETGRSKPSREMVIRLADAMDIPLRERNQLLNAAGFSAVYAESSLDEPMMAPIKQALDAVLAHHDPFPAIVIDRLWNVRLLNVAAQTMLGAFTQDVQLPDFGEPEVINMAVLSLHPQGMRRVVTNWPQVAPQLLRRLRQEAGASASALVKQRFREYENMLGDLDEYPLDPHVTVGANGGLWPVLPVEMHWNGYALKLFSVISTFGTPQDITTDELRIESFYPADDVTREVFEKLA